MKRSPLEDVRIFEFPKICDPRGNLSFIEGGMHVPFSIKRIFYIYDVPGGESRGAHAHRTDRQVLVALTGSFEVRMTDGRQEKTFLLKRANQGLYVPAGVWTSMHDFTGGALCLALSSELYEEEDYMRDYDEYLDYMKGYFQSDEDAPRS